MVFVYACLSAQAISFNSAWNRDSALAGIRQLSRRLPEPIDHRLVERIDRLSGVLPVPVDLAGGQERSPRTPTAPLRIVWNHRWEFDKGPELLLAIVEQLVTRHLRCELAIVGQQFRKRPDAFDAIEQRLAACAGEGETRLVEWGFVEAREDYRALLARTDVVLSTAWHDFQGLGVIEAVAAGAVPLLPDRLAYPEFFAPSYLYTGGDDIACSAASACDRLLGWQQQGLPAVPEVSQLSAQALIPRYREKIVTLAH